MRLVQSTADLYCRLKQYKSRITRWHLDKNIKDEEMRIILREQQRRRLEGKDSVFVVRGRKVDPKKIERYVQRKGVNDALQDFSESSSVCKYSPKPLFTETSQQCVKISNATHPQATRTILRQPKNTCNPHLTSTSAELGMAIRQLIPPVQEISMVSEIPHIQIIVFN